MAFYSFRATCLATLLCAGLISAPASAQTQCNPEDEFLDPAKNYEYVYNGTVEIRHMAGAQTSTAGFSFTCTVIVNGEEPCFHSLKLSTCRLDDRTEHADHAGRDHSFNRLLRRGHIHFRLVNGVVDGLLVDPEEVPFVTNVRRGVLNVLRVSRTLLDSTGESVDGACEQTVRRVSSGRHHVQRSRHCDTARDVPSARSSFSLLPSMHMLDDKFYVESSCDYDTSSGQLKGASCLQTWRLLHPTADDVQVVVTQELSLLSERAADPPLERNEREASAALLLEDTDPYIEVGDTSVFGRLRELVRLSVPMMTPETPQKFTQLLRALRRKYESPLGMAHDCTDCSEFEKSVMEELAPSAVLQCGTAACLRQVADMLRQGQVTAARLTPLFVTWQWNTIQDADTAHTMFSLCELAPTRWCLLGLAAALRRSGAAAEPFFQVVDKLRMTATDMIGDRCHGGDAAVLLGLKTLSNLGDLALGDYATLDLVRICMTHAEGPVMIASEAVRTLSETVLPPKFAAAFKSVFQMERHALLTRQTAYLAFLRRFPNERSFLAALEWARTHRADPMSAFIMRHWKHFPRTDPQRALTRRLAASLGVRLADVPDEVFNSPSVSSVTDVRLDAWLRTLLPEEPAPAAGFQLWRLHGASFLPHLLLLNTTLTLAGGAVAPLQLELRAVGLEQFAHQLARDPQWDLSTMRGVLRQLVAAVMSAFGGRYGGASFVSPAEAAGEPGQLRLSPTVASWLRRLLQAYQAQAALPNIRPRAVLTASVMGSQVVYLTAEDVIRRLETLEPPAEPYHILGPKLFHSQTVFKFLEGQHRIPLAVGLPLEVFADGSVTAGAAAQISSRLHRSYRNLVELFNGDAQLSASAGLSLVMGLEVSLPPFARAGLQLNTTVYAPFSLNVSYALHNRTVRLTAPKPDRPRTLLLVRHGAQLRQGSALRPSPAADSVSHHCLPQSVYTGLSVCREFRHSRRLSFTAPLIYHVTGSNPDPAIDTYTLDLWSTAREDGYVHGGLFHLHLHRPAAAADHLRLNVGIRLKPINFNSAIFRHGQKANTTVDLIVGDEAKPSWHVHLIRAHTERDDVFYTETRGWLLNHDNTIMRGDLERIESLPWVAGTAATRRHEALFSGVLGGDRLTYRRQYRAAGRPGGDADFTAELRYRTVYRNTLAERLLAPQFFRTEADIGSAWLHVNYSRRLTTNDELTELSWIHTASAATADVTLAGLLNLTSTADSSARLVANLTSLETDSGRVLMYTAATGQYTRDREGAAVADRVRGSLQWPGVEYTARLQVDRPSDRLVTLNASVARGGGGRARLTASLRGHTSSGRQLSASLHLPGDQLRLTSDFNASGRQRPWLPWYRDDYEYSHSSQLWWSRYDVHVTSSLEAVNTSSSLRLSTQLAVARAGAPASVNSTVRLSWDRPRRLWNSAVSLVSPVLMFNSTVSSDEVDGAGMNRQFNQRASSPLWDIVDHELQGSVGTDCVNCSSSQRDAWLKLQHKWLRLVFSSSRRLANSGAAAGGLQKLDLQLDGKADFVPSMTCNLKPNGDFTMALTVPSVGPPPTLDIKYSLKPPSRWKKVFVRALEVGISEGGGRPVPALHVSLEATPGDPSQLAAELGVQPSAWLNVGAQLAGRLQATARQARAALLRADHPLNSLLRPLTGTPTLVDWVRGLPHQLHAAGSWLVHRAAALLSPWESVTAPVYRTARNVYGAVVAFVVRTTAGVRQRANEVYRKGADKVAQGPSLKDRAMGLLPPQLIRRVMQRLSRLRLEARERLPFRVAIVPAAGRTRLELTQLPDYANVETFWNISEVVRERLQQPTVLSELLTPADDRRPLAALWRSGRALALDGRSFVLPAVDGCRRLLLADVEQRAFSVLRSGRHLVMTFLDCNVVVNDGGHVHVTRFNVTLPKRFRTQVETEGGRLVVRSQFGLQTEVDLGCGVTLFRLDPWMASRTAGLLATTADGGGMSLPEEWHQFGLDSEPACPEMNAASGPRLDIDGCGRVVTPECSLLIGLEADARQHRRLCADPEPTRVRLTSRGPAPAPDQVRVLLAVADPAVDGATVELVAAALQHHLSDLTQTTVQYAMVADDAHTRPVWVDRPDQLQLEGHKLPAADLVRTLHGLMTRRPFPGAAAHRVLVVFSPSDELVGGASLTGLRRQLWSRRVAVHLVTPLASYPQLGLPLHGLTAGGRLVTADARTHLSMPQHQGDLGQLVVATSGVVWDSGLLSRSAATTAALMADAVWQQVASSEPGPPLPDEGDSDRKASALVPGGAATKAAASAPPLLLLPLTLLAWRLL